ncbi:CPBP family intramembrane glutamic endopeptidase [Mucilaginibacter segetis]|uniref:CPBP family intramembrane metalloprotease n=1 Tax=Mucilaginibacter segetis TaxID=2793071 RepID=A0A934UN05_9SPHI|nr:type II CAAX endopeptidase family protein [Mucilaginibacter segetis]MBK0379929.1 CPBP family intramembrane metalloprotease [Mucilaginibacter segetis]
MVKSPINQISPALQFLILVAITIGTILIGNLIGVGIISAKYGLNVLFDITNLNFTAPGVTQALWILQIIGTTLPLFLAPVFFSWVIVKEPYAYLKPRTKFPLMLLIVAFFVMMVSSPLIEFLSNINQRMVLPHFLGGVEHWMKQSEESAQKVTVAILQMHSVWDAIKSVLLVGLLTAIAEEFLFRGAMQTIIKRWTNNAHAAVWITAILFSAFHMEFYGFLPRLLLGALFGYFVVWSGSIWPAVWGHFLNNGTAVVVTYLYQQKKISLNPDDTHTFNYASYAVSFIIVIILLLVYKNIAPVKKQSADFNGEELG